MLARFGLRRRGRKLELWDFAVHQAGALGAPRFLLRDMFTRGDGALGNPWVSGGATWAISSEEATNTPTEGSDIAVNGSFAAWTGDDPDSWSVANESGNDPEVSEAATGESHADTPTPGGGMCNLYTSAGANVYINQSILTVDQWYVATVEVDTVTAGGVGFYAESVFSLNWATPGTKVQTFLSDSIPFYVGRPVEVATDVTFDDVTVKQLTLNTLFAAVEANRADVIASVELDAVTAGTQAGLVLNLDDEGTPANFVVAYHDGASAKLRKCVAGTYTTLINATTAYGAGQVLKVIKLGTSYSLYYNDVQVGTTQTIGDAGIISNTLHGLFSTYSGNQLDNFTLRKN